VVNECGHNARIFVSAANGVSLHESLNLRMRVLDMNAFGNPLSSTGGVQREQTMEEILASIRKIIESNEAITNPQLNDVDDFADSDAALETAIETMRPAAQMIHQTSAQPAVAQPLQIDVPAQVAPAVQPVAQPVETTVPSLQSEMARLVSQSPERRVAAAFDDLNSAFMKSKQMPMADVAEAMLRPMMQDWLDNNLPNLVERLVREEISRIARGDI
jgi:uncharacterized protein